MSEPRRAGCKRDFRLILLYYCCCSTSTSSSSRSTLPRVWLCVCVCVYLSLLVLCVLSLCVFSLSEIESCTFATPKSKALHTIARSYKRVCTRVSVCVCSSLRHATPRHTNQKPTPTNKSSNNKNNNISSYNNKSCQVAPPTAKKRRIVIDIVIAHRLFLLL